ncbi:MAG TPA: hypothetical protein VL651_02710 [Bacteroidia bacterium]|nr:hypothetical protein [Bacteroidia bacterium]
MYFYNSKTKKFAPNLSPSGDLMVNPKTGSVVQIPAEGYPGALENAIMMLKSGGEGYFIIPELFGFYRPDSGYCFIKIISVSKGLGTIIHPNVDSTRTDSINFVLPDPLAENFGDTLFTSAKLVEFPMISRCGDLRAMTDVFKFQLSWFDNGVQHKDILVYVDCPSDYGKDFFVEGKMYVITVIPLTDKAKGARTVYDQFPNDHLERYLLLQIK